MDLKKETKYRLEFVSILVFRHVARTRALFRLVHYLPSLLLLRSPSVVCLSLRYVQRTAAAQTVHTFSDLLPRRLQLRQLGVLLGGWSSGLGAVESPWNWLSRASVMLDPQSFLL